MVQCLCRQMNRIVLLVLTIALIGGAVVFFSPPAPIVDNSSIVIDLTPGPTDPNIETKESDERYLPYSHAAFITTFNKRRVLYFHADWCPTCRPLDASLTASPDQLPTNVVLFKTNYDKELELKRKYGITYQHTFVEVDKDGNALQTWSGGDVSEIVSRLQ